LGLPLFVAFARVDRNVRMGGSMWSETTT